MCFEQSDCRDAQIFRATRNNSSYPLLPSRPKQFGLQCSPVMSPFFSPVDSPATIPTISWKPTDESERTGVLRFSHSRHWPRETMSSSHYESAASPVRRAHNGGILYSVLPSSPKRFRLPGFFKPSETNLNYSDFSDRSGFTGTRLGPVD